MSTTIEELRTTVEDFINDRPAYIQALRSTPGDADQSDYYRWTGAAEARRQLAQALNWTVPHEQGEKTAPKEQDR